MGGPADGRQTYVPTLPWAYSLPLPPSPHELWHRPPAEPTPLRLLIAEYRRTAHIADDGARLYAYVRPS